MDPDGVARQRPAYTESQVIMTTVKVIVPFVLTYGLFTVFHGADSPGGGFQGGAIIAAVVLMIAFAFGIDATREWISNVALVGLATLGVAIFGGIALGSVALGGAFLEYPGYGALEPIIALKPYEWTKWGMEAVEIGGIAFIVAGVLMGLFFLLAAGYDPNGNDDTERDRDVDRPASEVHRNE
ncbi:MAG: MnhB domain-containing protein [Halobacteriota archaeon]